MLAENIEQCCKGWLQLKVKGEAFFVCNRTALPKFIGQFCNECSNFW